MHPDRLPNLRPMSLGSTPYRAPMSKKLVRAEDAMAVGLFMHELDMIGREIKAEREIDANRRVVARLTKAELTYYDEELAKVDGSLVKHSILAKRLNDLSDVNDDALGRFKR